MSKPAAKAQPQKQPPSKLALPQINQPPLQPPPETRLSENPLVSGTQLSVPNSPPAAQKPDLDFLLAPHFASFILKPSHVSKLWDSSRMKEDLVAIFQDFFKPKSSIEQEKVEYNEINIFAEFQLHNIIFSKNQLLFDNYKTTVLLNLFWRLLEFNTDQDADDDDDFPKPNNRNSNRFSPAVTDNYPGIESPTRTDAPSIRYLGYQDSSPENKFANLLSHKFSLFKTLLLECLNESEKDLAFTAEEVKRIADYAKDSYFKHLRLYDYVLNNKQLSEVKRITVQMNDPIIAPNLNDALQLGKESEQLTEEEEEELMRQQVLEREREDEEERQRLAEQLRREQEEGLDDKDEELQALDEGLRNADIDREAKLIIHNKLSAWDSTFQKTLDEKQKALEEKIAATQPKKK